MGMIQFTADQETIPAYIAEPVKQHKVPGVVILHELFGLNTDIHQWCDRFANEGYLAIAPNLFSRGSLPKCLVATFKALSAQQGLAFKDIEGARQYLLNLPQCSGKVGIVGFCMGGGFALVLAPQDKYEVSSVNYGRVPKDPEQVLRGACPIVGSYGKQDVAMPEMANRLETVLDKVGVEHDVKEYPGVGHSFMNQQSGLWKFAGRVDGFGYHQASSEDAWKRLMGMFSRHLPVDS